MAPRHRQITRVKIDDSVMRHLATKHLKALDAPRATRRGARPRHGAPPLAVASEPEAVEDEVTELEAELESEPAAVSATPSDEE